MWARTHAPRGISDDLCRESTKIKFSSHVPPDLLEVSPFFSKFQHIRHSSTVQYASHCRKRDSNLASSDAYITSLTKIILPSRRALHQVRVSLKLYQLLLSYFLSAAGTYASPDIEQSDGYVRPISKRSLPITSGTCIPSRGWTFGCPVSTWA